MFKLIIKTLMKQILDFKTAKKQPYKDYLDFQKLLSEHIYLITDTFKKLTNNMRTVRWQI